LDLLLEACETSADCAGRFPGLSSSIESLLRELDREPPREFRVRHPRTGEWEEVPIRPEVVSAILRVILYSPSSAALIPLLVESAVNGDYGPLMVFADPASGPELAIGMFLSVVCAEDIPFLTLEEAEEAAADTIFDTSMANFVGQACEIWPRGPLPDGYREPVVSEAPVLILSGELDPVTPPRWGETAARTLSNSRHIVVPGAGHGTMGVGCVRELMEDFLETEDAAGLDPSCLAGLERPRFWPSMTGPEPPSPEASSGPGAGALGGAGGCG